QEMRTPKYKLAIKMRAATALLLMLLGWFAAPVSLAVYEPDVCAMECCVEAGHCCCATRHAFVAGQLPDGDTEAVQAQLGPTCPAKCTAPSSFSLSLVRGAARVVIHDLDEQGPSRPASTGVILALDSPYFKPSPPRAPPTPPLV